MQAVMRRRTTALLAACAVVLAGCGQTVDGHASLTMYDPFRVGDLPAVDGPSGPKPDAPAPAGEVQGTDDGEVDRLALLSANDIAEYWEQNFRPQLTGSFRPVQKLLSYDSHDPDSRKVCGEDSYRFVNALYCPRSNMIAWDRGAMLKNARKYFGDMGITGVLAHEYGHAVQRMAKLVNRRTPGLVYEQQADCFAGNYLAWVAAGDSGRFELSTEDGLNRVLAGGIVTRDPLISEEDAEDLSEGHGSALDRIGAFQIGFLNGPSACAEIDMEEITRRRGDLPLPLLVDNGGTPQSGDVVVDADTVTALTDILRTVLSPENPPTLSLTPAACPDAEQTMPAAYCPASNTISVDLPALQQLGTPADESERVLLQGDNTAVSAVTSRYVLALQHQRGLRLDDAAAALRTACLTGVAQRAMAKPVKSSSGRELVLSGGDIDEAVAGLLTNGIVASDVNGAAAPAGFTRILAFRSGLLGDQDGCFQRF